ncbi:MAG TPA: glycoside hydrolase family 3 N-terminal domain-containing protein, partial [Aggregatilineales bacterium]|nr:glycoside hydrolase family 3 N-terminal domain-containing protein [Aggregatilineales bacterium]
MNRRQFLTLTLAAGITGWRLPFSRLTYAQSSRVDGFLAQMSTRQKVGQLFLFAQSGTTFTNDMRRLITEHHAGGMTLFSDNIDTPEQVTQLTNDIQRTALESGMPIPLFIAADQEGGIVLRMRKAPFSPFPGPMTLGAADDTELTARFGAAIAVEMAACGLNMNLAPVLDVNTQADNPVI